MSPHLILQALYDDIGEWVAEQSGVLTIAKDPWQTLEILSERPKGFRVILHWNGDQPGSEDELHESMGCYPLARSDIELFLSKNLGLGKDRNKPSFDDGDDVSLAELVSTLRSRVLSLTFPDDGETLGRFRYDGCDPVITPDGWPLTAYKLRFSIVTVVDVDVDEREVELDTEE